MTDFRVIGLTDNELRNYALDTQAMHDPSKQEDNGYERCMHCHYTRHPCDAYDLATAVLQLLDRGRHSGEPVGEYTGLAAEQFLERLNKHGNVIDYGPQFGEEDDTSL